MRISVIIPVYNVERYLVRCLDSVRTAARGLDCEIICVNDGSTDGSAAILARYADRVRVVTKANGGLGSARNAGLDVATGDYILFVDSDDWIPEYAIRRFAEVAESSKAALVVSTSFAKDRLPRRRRSAGWRMRPSAWIAGRKVQYCAWNKLYRADLWKSRRYPATIYEDFPVTTGILCDVGEFAAIDEPLYVYCTNAGATSLVRSPLTERKVRDSLTVVRMVLDHAVGSADSQVVAFARRQAADGLSSTIGQVWKAGDPALTDLFLPELRRFFADFPELRGHLKLKARWRLWRMKTSDNAGLRRERIVFGSEGWREIGDIMGEAFGGSGWTIDMLQPFLRQKNVEAMSYHDGDRLIGFSIVHADKRFFFGIFLAIRAGLRGHGYGSAIMRDVLNRHHGKIGYFSVEAPDDSAPNAEQRRARIRLYERFGLRIMDRSLISHGCRYVCMSNNEWLFPARLRVAGAEYYAGFNAFSARLFGEPVCPKCGGRGSVGRLPFGLFRTICPVCKGSGVPG